MFTSFVNVVTCIYFIPKWAKYHIVFIALHRSTTLCLPIHQLVGSWAVFHFLAIINDAAVNICAQVFVWTYFQFL